MVSRVWNVAEVCWDSGAQLQIERYQGANHIDPVKIINKSANLHCVSEPTSLRRSMGYPLFLHLGQTPCSCVCISHQP